MNNNLIKLTYAVDTGSFKLFECSLELVRIARQNRDICTALDGHESSAQTNAWWAPCDDDMRCGPVDLVRLGAHQPCVHQH